MVSERQMEIVQGYIEKGIAEGARLVCGGKQLDQDGFFLEPTVFADVKDDMTIAREEIFGPVMAVLDFEDEDDVMARANDTEFGLAAGVFTRDLVPRAPVSRPTLRQALAISTPTMTRPLRPRLAGPKNSGVGRENSKAAIEHYSQTQVRLRAHGRP